MASDYMMMLGPHRSADRSRSGMLALVTSREPVTMLDASRRQVWMGDSEAIEEYLKQSAGGKSWKYFL